MKKTVSLVLFILISFFTGNGCMAARILGIVPTPSYSHQVVFQPLWKELHKKGHEVVVFTTDPLNDPSLTNLTEIDWSEAYQIWKSVELDNLISNNKIHGRIIDTLAMFEKVLNYELKEHPSFKQMLEDSKEHFDLVIIEYFYPILGALARRFNCPYIGMSSMELPDVLYDDVGLPVHPVLHPFVFLPFNRANTYTERLISTTVYFSLRIFIHFHQKIFGDPTVKEIFGEDAPTLDEIRRNVSLLLINANPVLFEPRATVPAYIQIGGNIQMLPLRPLSEDIELFLKSAQNGAIYFSLGTNVQIKHLPIETMNHILNAFKELPYKVLWKVDNTSIQGLPDNILTRTWFPQQDLLRHPKVKLFITQGGLQSLEEALYSKVPIIGLPFYADQNHNIRRVVDKGMGLYLDPYTLSKEAFKQSIRESMTNRQFQKNVEKLLKISLDQPMTGLDKAVWWVEYVIRHKGAEHLRHSLLNLPFYQHVCLDIILVVSICIILSFIIVYKFVKYLFYLKNNIICI